MQKLLDSYFKKMLKEHINTHYPHFLLSKVGTKNLSGTYFSGCDVYEWKINPDKKAWIIAGGVKDRDIDVSVAIGWTLSGLSLKDDCVKLWRKSEESSPPINGLLMLTDEELIGNDLLGERWLSINKPSESQQKEALDIYSLTDFYKKTRDIGAAILRKKNPNISEEEIDMQEVLGNRPFFRFWDEVAKYLPLNEEVLNDIIQPVLDRVFYLTSKHAIPFLIARMEQKVD